MEKIDKGLKKFYRQPGKEGIEADRNGEACGYYSMQISEMMKKGFETVPIYYPRQPIDEEKEDFVASHRKSFVGGNCVLAHVNILISTHYHLV